MNYSTPIGNYSAAVSNFDGLQQYNNLLRNLHSKQNPSSTSSSPNSSTSSNTSSTAASTLSNSLTTHLNSLVEHGTSNYHHLLTNGHNLPITPDESNSNTTDLSPSSSILSYSSARNTTNKREWASLNTSNHFQKLFMLEDWLVVYKNHRHGRNHPCRISNLFRLFIKWIVNTKSIQPIFWLLVVVPCS